MNRERITESELILPSLYLMSVSPAGRISTSELIRMLTEIMKPQGIDAMILNNRNDTYFSQKVRNLKSHDTLTKRGFALYSDGSYQITNIGRELVEEKKEHLQYILSSDFDYSDIKTSMGKIYKARKSVIVPYKEIIAEGKQNIIITKSYERSTRLRNAAIEHFSKNGTIICDCCNFEFRSFYGEKYGTPCIEIHHLKPIFQYVGMSVKQTIDEALKNLLPVCPNCHRVIHRNHISANMIADFKKYIVCQKNT